MTKLLLQIIFILGVLLCFCQARDYSKPQITSFASPFAPPMPTSGMSEFSSTKKGPMGPKGPIGNVVANAMGGGGSTSANGYSEMGGNVMSNAVQAPPPGYQG